MGIINDSEINNDVKNEKLDDFLLSYRGMIELSRNVLDKIDMTRYHRLESKVNNLWLELSNKEQMIAVNSLVESGHMIQKVADMLVIFEGRIDMSKPLEPCYRIG